MLPPIELRAGQVWEKNIFDRRKIVSMGPMWLRYRGKRRCTHMMIDNFLKWAKSARLVEEGR